MICDTDTFPLTLKLQDIEHPVFESGLAVLRE